MTDCCLTMLELIGDLAFLSRKPGISWTTYTTATSITRILAVHVSSGHRTPMLINKNHPSYMLYRKEAVSFDGTNLTFS